MSKRNHITQEKVKELFDYHPDGYLVWKEDQLANKVAGTAAGTSQIHQKHRYLKIGIDKRVYMTHRLIFLWHHGWLPQEVDHKDTNRMNNKITNLRPCTHSENTKNKPIYKNNVLRLKGVTENRKSGRFIARIRVNKKIVYLGIHPSKEVAAQAYNQAALKYFGEFARLNEIP